MSDKAKLTIENSFNRLAEQPSKDTLRPFLEEGETFYSALQKLVKDSFKRPGLNIKEPTIGKVLKVVKKWTTNTWRSKI